MTDSSIVILGLPESGKTTYLAALWHQVTSNEIETKLKLKNLTEGDQSYLNAIAARWREATIQERTAISGEKIVSMNLVRNDSELVHVVFPDLPGEVFQNVWSNRDCPKETEKYLLSAGVMLFIHADTIESPKWVIEESRMATELDLEEEEEEEEVVAWHPGLAPTQVKLVDLLQLLHQKPLNVGPRRIAIMLSAWDKAKDEGLSPEDYFNQKLPMLNQYLEHSPDSWEYQIYSISAQGGDYDESIDSIKKSEEAEKLRELDIPSNRIQLIGPSLDTQDITVPLSWIIE